MLNELDRSLSISNKIGDVISGSESFESFGTDSASSVYEDPYQKDSPMNLLKQIESVAKMSIQNEREFKVFQSLMRQLSDKVMTVEQGYKKRFREMRASQDSSFADLFIGKNCEINKLRIEVENLNSRLQEAKDPILNEEVMGAKNESKRLREMLQVKCEEISKLTYKLIDAKSYIDSLEKEKCANTPSHPSAELVREHIHTIREALQANQNMMKLIQTKTCFM